MPKVIVPVGFIMGPEYGGAGAPDRDPNYWEVHLGGDAQTLTTEEFSVWAAAFTDPPAHAGLETNRARLEQLLSSDDGGLAGRIAEPAPLVSRLLQSGLLVEFDPADGPLQEVCDQLRLLPQGQGLGSTAAEPDAYRIGFGNQPVAQVTSNVYQLWSYACTFPTLWQACVDMAAAGDAVLAPGEEPLGLDAETLAREVATVLPLLVSVGAAFLDPR
ncbi:MAG: hypothetical protein ACRDMV_03705 [Streptosporangiales bacterium]